MSVSQHFGVLRVVRVLPTAHAKAPRQDKKPRRWFPEEQFVHVLTRRETTIGRAFNCDLVLLDSTVSREHARLALEQQGWRLYNLTEHNSVYVNGHAVPTGESLPIHPQDFFVLGSTTLQLIAPLAGLSIGVLETSAQPSTQTLPLLPAHTDNSNGHAPQLVRDQEASVTDTPAQEPVPIVSQSVAAMPQAVTTSEHVFTALPDTELLTPAWDNGEENVLGAGITMQFALTRRLGRRMLWLIAGIGIAIVTVGAVVAIVLHSIVRISVLVQDGPFSLLSVLTIPLIPAIGISLLVNFIDRYEREPWFLRLAAFLWGAVIAAAAALLIEQNLLVLMSRIFGSNTGAITLAIFKGLSTGVTEETVKGLGLILLFFALRDEFDNVTDGIVYGALIGAGFAMVENFFIFAENPRQLLFLVVGRIVLGWLCHSTFTVCFGMALGYIRHTRKRWQHFVIPLLGYLVAVGLHTVFDFINTFASDLVFISPNNPTVVTFSLIAVVGNYIPTFIAQIVIMYFLIKALAHEVALIREFLASEVSKGVVTVAEYALLQHSFARTKEERRVLRDYGLKQWLRVKSLYQTEIGLAFRKWHVSMGDKPKLGYVQPEDAYRRRIMRLRQEIMATEVARKGA